MSKIKKSDVISSDVRKEFDKLQKSVQQLTADLKTMVKAAMDAKTEMNKTGITMINLNSATKKLKTNTTQLKQAEKEANTIFQKSYDINKKLAEGYKKRTQSQWRATKQTKLEKIALESGIGSYKRINLALNNNIKKYQMLSAAQRKNKAIGGALLKTIQKQDKALKNMDKTLGRSQRHVGNYGRALGGLKNLMGAAGFAGGMMLFVGAVKDAIKVTIEFSKSQSNLAAILGKTKDEITDLTDDAIKYGGATKFTATEVTHLQTELAKLGFGSVDIKNMTKDILDFAAATGGELGEAAKVTGIALKAFGLASTEAGRVTSTLAVATTKSALSFNDYETALSTVAPVAKAFGFSMEDTIAMLGKLKDAGFDTSSGATAMRNIFLKLADSNSALSKALGKPVRGLDDMVDGMAKLTSEGISLDEMLQLTDKRSIAAFATFVKTGEGLTELRDSITGVNEELGNMVDTQLDNLAGDITILGSAWDGFILSLERGDGVLAKASRGITQFFTAFFQQLANMDVLLVDAADATEEEITRIYDYLSTVPNSGGKEFQAFLKKWGDLNVTQLAESREEMRKELENMGYDLDEADMLLGEFAKRKVNSQIFTGDTEAEWKSQLDKLVKLKTEANTDAERENYNTSIQIWSKQFGEWKKLKEEQEAKDKKAIEDATAMQENEDEKAAKKRRKASEKKLADDIKDIHTKSTVELKAIQDAATVEIDAQKRILAAEGGADNEDALTKLRDAEIKKAEATKEAKLRTNAEMLKLDKNYADQSAIINNDYLNTKQQAELQYKSAIQDIDDKAAEKRMKATVDTYTKEQNALKTKLANKEISEEEYTDAILELQKQQLKAQLDSLEKVVAAKKMTTDQRKEYELEISNLKAKIADTEIKEDEEKQKRKDKKDKKDIEDAKKKIEKISEYNQIASGIADKLAEFSQAQNKQQLSDLEIAKQHELELAGDSAEAREKIEEKYAAKMKTIKKQQAKEDKQKAMFDIILHTAVGIMKAAGNIPMMISIGVMGAIELATVAMQPLPQFAEGVRDYEGGKAELAEEGSEIVRTNQGMFIAKKRGIYNLPKGADVFTHEQSERMLEIRKAPHDNYDEFRDVKTDMLLQEINENIKNQKQVQINVSRRGIEVMRGSAERWTRKLNDLIK
jgi:TP901 family phage tail tape measure protein